MDIIQNYAGTQFTSKEFQEDFFIHRVRLSLVAPDHQEMNGQAEVIWQILQSIAHSIIVHAQVYDEYIHFTIIYTTDHIFPVIPIKHLVNHDGEPNTPHKLATGMKDSVSNSHILFCSFVVQKKTGIFDTKGVRHTSSITKHFPRHIC